MNWIKQNKLLSFFLALFCLLGLLVALSSQIIIFFLRSYLSDHASDVELSSLQVNWWRSDIEITGLATRDSDGNRFSVNELYLDWVMTDLWDNQLTVESLKINGLKVDIKSDNFKVLKVGPITIPATTTTEVEEPVEPWAVTVSDVAIHKSNICVSDNSASFHSVSLPLTTDQSLNTCMGLDKLTMPGTFNLDIATGPVLESPIELAGFSLKLSDDTSYASIGQVLIEPLSFTMDSLESEKLKITDITLLSSDEVDISDNGIRLSDLTINQFKFVMESSDLSVASIQAESFNLYTRASDQAIHSLVSLASAGVEDLKVKSGDISLSNLQVGSTNLLENFQGDADNTITQIGQISVAKLSKAANHISVGDTQIESLQVSLVMDETGVNAANWFAQSDQAVEEEASAESVITWDLSSFKLGGESTIQFEDNSLGNPLTQSIHELLIDLGTIAPGQSSDTPVTVAMKINEHGTFNAGGVIKQHNNTLGLQLEGALKHLDMVDLSPYAQRFIGYRVDTGQLNLDYKFTINEHDIDATLETKLERFELGELQEHEKHELNDELGLPLPLALDLIRDSDNNISLNIPIHGKTDDPQFSVAGIISTVTVKAIKNAVIYHYSPLGMLTLASGVFDLATALKFDPVQFEPQNTELDAGDKEQLDKVVKVLADKPRVKFVVCAVATEADQVFKDEVVDQPVAETTDKPQPPKVRRVPTLGPEQLVAIANERQQKVLDYLKSGSIPAERLLACNIKIAKDKADKPVVNLSL